MSQVVEGGRGRRPRCTGWRRAFRQVLDIDAESVGMTSDAPFGPAGQAQLRRHLRPGPRSRYCVPQLDLRPTPPVHEVGVVQSRSLCLLPHRTDGGRRGARASQRPEHTAPRRRAGDCIGELHVAERVSTYHARTLGGGTDIPSRPDSGGADGLLYCSRAVRSRSDRPAFGLWRSLVAHLTGGQGVAGSNPVSPTGHEAVAEIRGGLRRTPGCPDRRGTRFRSWRPGRARTGTRTRAPS